jgi:hypothetical protein
MVDCSTQHSTQVALPTDRKVRCRSSITHYGSNRLAKAGLTQPASARHAQNCDQPHVHEVQISIAPYYQHSTVPLCHSDQHVDPQWHYGPQDLQHTSEQTAACQ